MWIYHNECEYGKYHKSKVYKLISAIAIALRLEVAHLRYSITRQLYTPAVKPRPGVSPNSTSGHRISTVVTSGRPTTNGDRSAPHQTFDTEVLVQLKCRTRNCMSLDTYCCRN